MNLSSHCAWHQKNFDRILGRRLKSQRRLSFQTFFFFSVVATDISNRMKVFKSVEAFIRTERKRSPKKIRLIFFRDSLRYISPEKCLVLFIRFIWISIHGMIASFVAVDKLPKRAFLFKAHQINFRDMHEVITVTTGHYPLFVWRLIYSFYFCEMWMHILRNADLLTT